MYKKFCYSSSPAEKAYEVAGGAEGGQDLGTIGKDNSIFVAAMKEHLGGRGSLTDAVQDLFNATAKRESIIITFHSLFLRYNLGWPLGKAV